MLFLKRNRVRTAKISYFVSSPLPDNNVSNFKKVNRVIASMSYFYITRFGLSDIYIVLTKQCALSIKGFLVFSVL